MVAMIIFIPCQFLPVKLDHSPCLPLLTKYISLGVCAHTALCSAQFIDYTPNNTM